VQTMEDYQVMVVGFRTKEEAGIILRKVEAMGYKESIITRLKKSVVR
jgi:hypothetical protein